MTGNERKSGEFILENNTNKKFVAHLEPWMDEFEIQPRRGLKFEGPGLAVEFIGWHDEGVSIFLNLADRDLIKTEILNSPRRHP